MNARSTSRARRVSNKQTIPAYSSSGQRLRNYSLEAANRFLELKPPACVAKRSKLGRVVSIQFFPLPESSSACREAKEKIRATAHMGQAYSFKEKVDDGSGRRVWAHSRLLLPRSEEADIQLRLIFRAVPLSCLVEEEPAAASVVLPCADPIPEPPSPPPSNVFTMRPRSARPQPVDDDIPLLKAA